MLTVNQQTISLGTLPFGVSHNFDYQLTNQSKDIVTITSVNFGCKACTSGRIEETVLLPNQSTKLYVTFTPGSTGLNNKTIAVNYSLTNTEHQLPLNFNAQVNG